MPTTGRHAERADRYGMDPTRLEDLLAEPLAEVRLHEQGMAVRTLASWVVPNEDHLSYTTITRLIECCREHHWAHDLVATADGTPVEAIARDFSATFYQPVPIGVVIDITYEVYTVRSRAYQIRFTVRDAAHRIVYARSLLTCIFYDPSTHHACRAAPELVARLAALGAGPDS